MPIPFLESGHSPSPVALGGPVCSAITTAFMTQAEEMLQDMKDLCHQWDCLAQEAGKAEKVVGEDVSAGAGPEISC